MSFKKRDPLDVYTNEIKVKEGERGKGKRKKEKEKSKGNSRRDVKWKPSENARRRGNALERKKF